MVHVVLIIFLQMQIGHHPKALMAIITYMGCEMEEDNGLKEQSRFPKMQIGLYPMQTTYIIFMVCQTEMLVVHLML